MQLYISSLAEEWQYKNPIEQFATLYGAGKCNQFYGFVIGDRVALLTVSVDPSYSMILIVIPLSYI